MKQAKGLDEKIANDPKLSAPIESSIDLRKELARQLDNKGISKDDFEKKITGCKDYGQLFDVYTYFGLDTSRLVDLHISEVAAYYNLYENCDILRGMTFEQKQDAVSKAVRLLGDPMFIQENPKNPNVLLILGSATEMSASAKLTNAEAIECLVEGTLGSIAAVGGIVGTIIGIATGQGLTTAVLNSLIRNAIRVGTFAAGGTAIAYIVACIAWNAWD